MTLREVLHAHIPTLTPASTLRDAVDKMDIYQFPALVVVDDDKAVLAILTEGDVCRAVAQQGSLLKLSDQPALQFSTMQPTTANPDTEVSDALHQMLSSGITLLPVVEHDRLLGIVLRVDLMQAMLMDQLD
ncbi:MAG: CBS domain-containing protein [Chthonomonas sp.]|nr:CBS domain-containing protein [Chthonomonas sp.]